ncbi:hypothetical protein NLU13_9131 [Sarocladium strictum]|uniref:Uncharacterized protein n=1 Tax=Sarocladium strictum TaxID=5046 RepID=A0AA39GAP0_SARSR|nr:hypothetical protein NLU13_9131 [Sarocladium strictum]
MAAMDTSLLLAEQGHQVQQSQQIVVPGTDGIPEVSFHGYIENGWLIPPLSQAQHFIPPVTGALPESQTDPSSPDSASTQLSTSPVMTWNSADAIGPNPNDINFSNSYPQHSPVHGILGSPSHQHHISYHVQYGGPDWQVPGNQGYPFMLESNMRNLHAHEFIMALCQERTGPFSRMHIHAIRQLLQKETTTIKALDLNGDHFDLQGIPWTSIGIPREVARRRRRETFVNHTNIVGADKFKDPDDMYLSSHRNFFRFRRLDAIDDTRLAHFQLRNLLACPSRTQAFYPTKGGLQCINPLTGAVSPALRMTPMASFSCVAADYGVVMAGALNGSYCIRRLDGKVRDTVEGSITRAVGGGANHLDMYTGRGSNSPHVGICSNDSHFRVMDLRTQRILSSWESDGPFNCSAVSADGRVRAMMGDLRPVVICDTTSGVRIQTLTGHRDYGFACAWSDDGWTLATGNQDNKLCIWDARKWCDSNGYSRPVTTIKSEMACVRSLKFSPVGSGQPVLVAAEDADFINIIDAQTYNSKQTIDIFGNIGGLAFTNEGRDLNVLCCDPTRGSLIQFERCGQEVEPLLENIYGDEEEFDLSSARDPRLMAHRETPYSDLLQDCIDAF